MKKLTILLLKVVSPLSNLAGIAGILLLIASFVIGTSAQVSAFTFQGRLRDSGLPTNALYDMQFKLFDSMIAGNEVAPAILVQNVQTRDGIFSVGLDFGQETFISGANRFLEISLKSSKESVFTVLTPRQMLGSSPFSVFAERSDVATAANNALNLGGVAANLHVLTNDPRLFDARPPLAGSNDYIQNTPDTQQDGVNFDIGGTGHAEVFSASQFNIENSTALSFGNHITNLHVGGASPGSTGTALTFVGRFAGFGNTTGKDNSFFGSNAGRQNTTGLSNSYFGSSAGAFGSGSGNSFFGKGAGSLTFSGNNNTFIGHHADFANTENPVGSGNTLLGSFTVVDPGVNNSTAVGIGVRVKASNTIVLGTGSQTTLAKGKLIGGSDQNTGILPGAGYMETFFLTNHTQGIFTPNLVLGNAINNPVSSNRLCFTNLAIPPLSGIVLGRCASLLSKESPTKTNVKAFSDGLNVVRNLTPIAFRRTDNSSLEIGLDTAEIERVSPYLLVRDSTGKAQDINSNSLSGVLINAIKQQQMIIDSQIKKIRAQKEQIDENREHIELLKSSLCSLKKTIKICSKVEQ